MQIYCAENESPSFLLAACLDFMLGYRLPARMVAVERLYKQPATEPGTGAFEATAAARSRLCRQRGLGQNIARVENRAQQVQGDCRTSIACLELRAERIWTTVCG